MSTQKRRTSRPKPIPAFRSEDEEHQFWATADSTDYFDFSKARRVSFPNLKRSAKSEVPSRRTEGLRPVSPGELLLNDFLAPMGLSAQQLASKIKVNPRLVRDVVANRRAISTDLDLRLCRFFRLSSGYWLRAQAAFDLEIAQPSPAKRKKALNTTRIAVRLDGKLLRELDRLCREMGRSRSEIVRDAVRRHLAGLAGFRS